jgi:hypothetical protein
MYRPTSILRCVLFNKENMEQANSTPTISDVISSAMDDSSSTLPIQNDKPTDTPVAETNDVATVDTPAVEEEKFTTFNPNNLTPELLDVYKKWQHDYTQTRQREKSELQTYKDKVAQYEQANNGTQAEKIDDFNTAKATGEIDPNMSFADYSRKLIDQAKEEFKNEFKTDQENEYIGNQEREFLTLDPRFQEGPALDKILLNHVASELSALRDNYEKENGTIIGFDFIGESKNLIGEYDGRINQSNKSFIQKQNELVKGKTNISNLKNPNAKNISGTSNGNMSFSDAFDDAFSKT